MAEAGHVSDFGGRMRRQREAQGVTLREISSATNISVAQLEALERNDVQQLPGGIFRRGIVRAYAQEVGADPEATVRDFIASVPGEPGIGGSAQAFQTDYEHTTAPRWGHRIGVLVVGLVILAAAVIWLVVALR